MEGLAPYRVMGGEAIHPHKLQQMLRKAATDVAPTVTRKAVTLTL